MCIRDRTNIVHKGDIVVLTGGAPVGVSGTTNILKVQLVGDVLLTATGTSRKSVSGTVCVAKNNAEAIKNFKDGDILVIPETSNDIIAVLRKASAIIAEQPGLTSHAAVVGMTLDIDVYKRQPENIIRITQKGMMSYPVTNVLVG